MKRVSLLGTLPSNLLRQFLCTATAMSLFFNGNALTSEFTATQADLPESLEYIFDQRFPSSYYLFNIDLEGMNDHVKYSSPSQFEE